MSSSTDQLEHLNTALAGRYVLSREIELAANLSHLPFVKGETLRHMLDREKQIPIERAVDLA